MLPDILDISVTSRRALGERRKGLEKGRIGTEVSPEHLKPLKKDPFQTAINHRKHVGKIYRDVNGGYVTKGQPYLHGDLFW